MAYKILFFIYRRGVFLKEIGERLSEARKKNGISIDEASEDLNISVKSLENIEAGNVRAFKDIYELKRMVQVYSKYLGLDVQKMVDEFNDFLFEHTSKLSLTDILEASRKKEKETKKIVSPYTKIKKNNTKTPLIFCIVIGVIFIFMILFIILSSIMSERDINTELKSDISSEVFL
jgi:cytoskeletal protein RodZ